MTTEPDKTLTHSPRAVVVPNSRLMETTCFNKVRRYDFEYAKNGFGSCISSLAYHFLPYLRFISLNTV